MRSAPRWKGPTVPDYLPTPPRLAALAALAVAGLLFAPVFDVVLWWRNRRRWEGEPDGR